MKKHIHLVSDSTGETVHHVALACLSQFSDIERVEHVWSFVRSDQQIENVIRGITDYPGIVICTFADHVIKQKLRTECERRKVPFVSVLDPILESLSTHFGIEKKEQPGRQHQLDQEYFDKIDAIDFALHHDDGQMQHELADADVVLIGVSRTSKTPTCLYLSHRGIKAANIPLVPGVELPDHLFHLKNTLVVGLVAEPERIAQVRQTRLSFLHSDASNAADNYADIAQVRDEMRAARQLFSAQAWPVIDVTRRSVEETAALILQLHHQFKETKKAG